MSRVDVIERGAGAGMPGQPPLPTGTGADAAGASVRAFARPGWRWWALLGVLVAVVAVGLYAWVRQLLGGMAVAGYNDHAFWAVYIADVVTFIGVSYGGAVISAILRLTGADWRAPLSRLAEGTAVVTVLIGAAFIVPHLGRPDRILELIYRPHLTSPIFWDFVAVSTYTIGSIVFFALPLLPDLAILRRAYPDRLGRRAGWYARASRGWVGAPRQRAVLRGALGLIAIMIIPLAVSVHSVLSWAFSLVSRPWWHESIWAPYFVVAALYSGVALVILVVAAFRRAYHLERFITPRHFVRLGFIMAAFAATYLYLTFADILPDAYVGEPDTTAVFQRLLVGPLAAWFWIFIVGAGVLPLLLVAIPRTRTVTGMVVAASVIVPAMWLKRMLMVVAPANYDRITGTFGTYHFTWVPISITLAGLAAIPLLLMLLFRAVPLLSIEEMSELDAPQAPIPAAPDGSGHPAAAGQPVAAVAEAPGSVVRGGAAAVIAAAVDAAPAMTDAAAAAGTGAAGTGGPARARRGSWWTRLRSAGAAGVLVLIAVLVGLAPTEPARAAAAPRAGAGVAGVSGHKTTPPPASIAVAGGDSADGLHLSATLTGPDRAPVAGATVSFFEFTTEFGPTGQLVPLGSAVTGKDGVAQLVDQPAVTGPQRFVASFAGGATLGKASATVTVTVTSARSPYRAAPPKPLAGVGRVLVGVLLVAVTAILLTLLIQVERVRRACRAGI